MSAGEGYPDKQDETPARPRTVTYRFHLVTGEKLLVRRLAMLGGQVPPSPREPWFETDDHGWIATRHIVRIEVVQS